MTAIDDPTTMASLVAAARMDGATSAATFRVLLDTLARPGTVGRLPDGFDARIPPALVPALALGDVGLRVSAIGPDAEVWSEVLRAAIGTAPAPLATAAIVVALRLPVPVEVHALERGDAMRPELGTRLLVACEGLVAGDRDAAGTVLALEGPGVDGRRLLAVAGADHDLFETLSVVNAEFPAGVDVHFVDAMGLVAGLPRSTSVEVLDGRGR